MRNACRRPLVAAVSAAAVAAIFVVPFGGSPARAASPAASAFGAQVQLAGDDLIPATPTASVATRGDDTNTLIDVPAEPVLVNGTLTATANAHATADIASGLTVVEQAVAGPYQGRALAQIEGADVLYEVAGAGIPLLSADAVRAEAAVVCGTTPRYTANSEVVDLQIAGESIPLNAPVQDLIDAISGVLTDSGLNAVADVQRNVVTPIAGGGISVDALVVTVLAAAGDEPLAQVRLAHAEVTAAACSAAATPTTAAPTQCSDGADNDGDTKIDAADPGCHSDNDATNPASYVPSDNDERDVESTRVASGTLPRTGSEADLALAGAGLATLATLIARLRQRLAS